MYKIEALIGQPAKEKERFWITIRNCITWYSLFNLVLTTPAGSCRARCCLLGEHWCHEEGSPATWATVGFPYNFAQGYTKIWVQIHNLEKQMYVINNIVCKWMWEILGMKIWFHLHNISYSFLVINKISHCKTENNSIV